MKKYFCAVLLASMLVPGMAIAEKGFAGLSLGQAEFSKDVEVETTNLGIVLGAVNEIGFGYEVFYSITLDDDSETVSGTEITGEIDTLGLYAMFKTPGDVYFKAKAGYSFVSHKLEIEDVDSFTDTSDGFSYGLSVGAMIGGGALELSYYRFADFDEFSSLEEALEADLVGTPFEGTEISLEAEVEMLNLTYIYAF